MSAASSPARNSFRCAFGWHDAEPLACWNDGYYFARCRRCAVDLVRTAYGRWHSPRGFRVVWSSTRPANAPSAELLPMPEAEAQSGPAPAGRALPIEEVLRHLEQDERRMRGQPAGSAAGQRPPTYVPDFMEDANTDTSWRTNRPPRWPPSAPDPADSPAIAARPSRAGRLNAALSGLAADVRGALATETAAGAAEKRGSWGKAALAFAGLILLSAVVVLPMWGRPPQAVRNAAPAAPVGFAGGQTAFVATNLLNCRSGPAPEADQVGQLERGDAVGLIALDGDWASISYRGEQCWALRRYLSVESPMSSAAPEL
jgi:Bacterial SH3 domain